MVGEGAGQGHAALDRVEAEGGSISLAPVDELASEADLIGPVAERIGFEGDHDIGFAETGSQPERLTVNRLRGIVVGILGGLEHVPAHVRVSFKDSLDLIEQSRRGDSAAEQA